MNKSNKNWAHYLEMQTKSDLNMAEFCRKEKLNYQAFIYHYRRKGHTKQVPKKLLPVVVPDDLNNSGISISLFSHVKIELDSNFNQIALKKILSVFEEMDRK